MWKWLAAQEVALLGGLALVVAGGFVGGLVGILTIDALSGVGVAALGAVAVGGFLLFGAIGAIAVLLAVRAPTTGRAIGVVVAFVLVSFALDFLAEVWSLAEPFGPLSVFHYYDPGVILGAGSMPTQDVLGLALVGLVALAAAHAAFSTREIAR
jgi:hypothetical protein